METNNLSNEEKLRKEYWARLNSEGEVLREDQEEIPRCYIPKSEIERLTKEILKRIVNGTETERNRTDNKECIQLRYDTVETISPTLKEGRFIATAVFARAGVQTYLDRDGKVVREFRPPEEVRKATSEYAYQPITLEHPNEFINSNNIEKYIVGLSGESWFEDDLIKGIITLFNQNAIKASQITHQQFSHGYECRIEYESGIWTDKYGVQGPVGKQYKYDRIQRDIKGNHTALVAQARAGDVATFDDVNLNKFRNDSTQEIEVLTAFHNNENLTDMENKNYQDQEMVTMDMGKGKMEVPKAVKDMYERGEMMFTKDMVSVSHDEEEYLMPKKAADAFNKMKKDMGLAHSKKDSSDDELGDLQSRLDTSRKERKELEIKCDSLEAKINQLNSQLEELESNPRIDEDTMQKELEMRSDAYNRRIKLIGEVDFDASKSASDWKKEALKELTPSVKLDSLSEEELNARFDTLEQVFGGENSYSRQIKKAGAELSSAVNSFNSSEETYTPVLPQDRPLKFTK